MRNTAKKYDDSILLWELWFNEKTIENKNNLVVYYLDWVKKQAKKIFFKYPNNSLELADYIHWGTIGLIESIFRYDPSIKSSFEAFAILRVKGEILTNLSKISDESAISSVKNKLISERINSLSSDEANFDDILDFVKTFTIGVILEDEMIFSDNSEYITKEPFMCDFIFDKQLDKGISSLSTNERLVVNYHYYSQLNFSDIAELLALTKGRVSQIHREALEKLSIYF